MPTEFIYGKLNTEDWIFGTEFTHWFLKTGYEHEYLLFKTKYF